jgi:hypothetical protein
MVLVAACLLTVSSGPAHAAGQTWAGETSGTAVNLRDVFFLDHLTGWAVGDGGTVLSTTDGGHTWASSTPTAVNLSGVTAVGSACGPTGQAACVWVAGDNGTILHSNDGGATWCAQTTPNATPNLHRLITRGSNDVIAVGDGGTILASGNGGTNAKLCGDNGVYDSVASSTSADLYGVTNTTNGHVYAVGDGGTIVVDSGSGFATITPAPTPNNLRDVAATCDTGCANSFVYAVGATGTILQSTNDGAFATQTSATSVSLSGIDFSSGTAGWIVASDGTIQGTTDGSTWSAEDSGVATALNGVFHSSSTKAFAVGDGGVIRVRGNAPFVANTTGDAAGGACAGSASDCPLRSALQLADADTISDIIFVPAGTYGLTLAGSGEDLAASGDLDIVGDLDLIGAGASTTVIDASGLGDRVLDLRSGALAVSKISVENGNTTANGTLDTDGGGIRVVSGASLTTDHVVLQGNNANRNGGGISYDRAAGAPAGHLSATTFANNQAASGGGLFNNDAAAGTAPSTLDNTTFNGNSGGALNQAQGTVNIRNSTIDGNTGGGLTLAGSTAVNIANSIVADNGTNCSTSAGVSSLGGNLEDANSCGFAGTSDHTNTPSNLNPLAANASAVPTMVPKPNSAAIDGGLNAQCLGTDQRDIVRPFDGNGDGTATCDIGAVEVDTSTLVVSSANPSAVGQQVTFTATVSAAVGTPTGTVDFTDTGSDLGSMPLSGGVAALSTASLSLGSHNITAVYSGDAAHLASQSLIVVQVVGQAATSAVVDSSKNPDTFGENITFTATVAVTAPGAGSPTGTVTFNDGATKLADVALSGPKAAVITHALTGGSHSITAVYNGDANFAPSTSPVLTQVVDPIGTTVTLSSSRNPSSSGQAVKFAATVNTASGTPTGSIDFMDGSTMLGSVSLTAGSAVFSTTELQSGTRSITAVYPGDTNHAGSTSDVISQVVNRRSPEIGYWLIGRDGGIFAEADAPFLGSLGGRKLNAPVVAGAPTRSGKGYWLVATDGGIFTFGDAGFFGSMGGTPLNQPIVGMASTPSGLGYWLVAKDGGIFSFGDAGFFGSMGGTPLNQPIVGMASTPSGLGYWLVAKDGGIFAFGDAVFLGSTGGISLNSPVVGIAVDKSGGGYWMAAADGGIFAFGDAPFLGSEGGTKLNSPVVGIAVDATGGGYWMDAADGGIFNHGDAPFFGSEGSTKLNAPMVGMMAAVPPT